MPAGKRRPGWCGGLRDAAVTSHVYGEEGSWCGQVREGADTLRIPGLRRALETLMDFPSCHGDVPIRLPASSRGVDGPQPVRPTGLAPCGPAPSTRLPLASSPSNYCAGILPHPHHAVKLPHAGM